MERPYFLKKSFTPSLKGILSVDIQNKDKVQEGPQYVFNPQGGDVPSVDDVGGKAMGLYRLQKTGALVPAWFAVTSASWLASRGESGSSSDKSTGACLPTPEVMAEIKATVDDLSLADRLLAVRSSVRVEDSSEQSFAGQFTTVLNVEPAHLASAISRVWASAGSKHCREYAKKNDVPLSDLVPAVVIQQMLDPEISGVMFTADPVSGSRDTVVISALYGLGEGIVDGSCNADSYHVDKTGRIIERKIAHKTQFVGYDKQTGKTHHLPVPDELRDNPVCSDDLIRRLAKSGKATAASLGSPQDLEWCLADDEICMVQARNITTSLQPEKPIPDEPVRIWDNANLIESYPGITLPLTFSFIDAMYSGVYRQLSIGFGLDESSLKRGASDFHMLGYHRGRVYYNLLNWYGILSRLPGGARHCRHFDEMLGTGMGAGSIEHPSPNPPGFLRSSMVALRLAAHFLFLPAYVRRFMAIVNDAREHADAVDLAALSLSGLMDHYQSFENLLLQRWTTPQYNDFFCQTATGLLKSAITHWLGEAYVSHMHDLLPVEESVESERAVISLNKLAESVRKNPRMVQASKVANASGLLEMMQSDPDIGPQLAGHLYRYGDRWQAELKLETVTPREDPLVLMEVLANHVSISKIQHNESADSPICSALKDLPLVRKLTIQRLVKLSRRFIANRENTRFERTRVFGMVRRTFRMIGQKLAERGQLNAADDVFYLTRNEVFGLIEGTSVDTDPIATVRQRREAFAGWRLQTLPGRFVSHGLLSEMQFPCESVGEATAGRTLTGTGASPGIVRGTVKVVRSPQELGNVQGCIVAAESTDPGWSFIFPLISGILVERGSMLSHAAIVAREMNIPAIVAIDGLMERIQQDCVVQMDGGTGTIELFDD